MRDWFKTLLDKTLPALLREGHWNEKVLDVLGGVGADLSKPHMVEHFLYCDDETTMDRLADAGCDLGFNLIHRGLSDPPGCEPRYVIILVKPTVTELAKLNRDSARLRALAEKFGAENDGWGCGVVK